MLLMIPPETREEKAARLYGGLILSLLAIAVMVLLLALFAPAAKAQSKWSALFKAESAEGGAMSLRLFDEPCSDAAVIKALVGLVKPEFLDKFRSARLHWQGKEYASCWLEYGGMVYAIDEEGAALQPLPKSAFKDDGI
jgi:hypothetical protein